MKNFLFAFLFMFSFHISAADKGRNVISLNGIWEFEQTETAFPPVKFTRKIPVPGLIHLAVPRISQYDKFFIRPSNAQQQEQHNLLNRDYTPMYSWYKRKVKIEKGLNGQEVFLTIKKSQYVTVVYVNGMLAGRSMECYTPIDLHITDFIKFGEENEILVQVGDRAWLPSEAAGSTDKEKVHYLPGIWDDVFISTTGKLRVDKALFLPSLEQKTVTVKLLLRSLFPPQIFYGDRMKDSCTLKLSIREKASGKNVSYGELKGIAQRDRLTFLETAVKMDNAIPWTPENPYLYEGEICVYQGDVLTDIYSATFGMRDFSRNGRFFTLNGDKYYLRGSNITLQRFFEDPDCRDLVWNREWVKKLMIDLPKSTGWNAMRICVGIVPDFWYDLCDEYGIVLQNEWFYWQNHGWDGQIRQEYTNWVWSDGNHPSIVIWDAINENWDEFIGNTLIPELKHLDPTRIWDAGYMTSKELGSSDEMDEPHPYRAVTLMQSKEELNEYFRKNPYNLGDLDDWNGFTSIQDAGVPQLVNEYGWIWLWRNGNPSKLTVNNYSYYLGTDATTESRRALQAYWLQLETEWLRSERSIAGVLAFCHLTNNYGFTGDWFINDIKDLETSPAFKWFKHCFAPEAVFINLADRRYAKHLPPYSPQANIIFQLVGVNDQKTQSNGNIKLKLLDKDGNEVNRQELSIIIPSYGKKIIPCQLKLPEKAGGYLLVAEYYPSKDQAPVISRRYLKVGDSADSQYSYFEINP